MNVPTARSLAQRPHNPENPLGAKQAREPVNGVRRIWGTLRACTHMTVLSTLQRLTTTAEKVEVRRKFKKRDNNEIRWWFLIRGEETDLQTLETQWENVENSTSWKLERCFQPVVTNSPNEGHVQPADVLQPSTSSADGLTPQAEPLSPPQSHEDESTTNNHFLGHQ